MIKKQAMAAGRQFGKTGLTMDQIWWNNMWNNNITARLETGYVDNHPHSHPYWVRPCNCSPEQWYHMEEWMNNTFGECIWTKTSRWVGASGRYWFRDAADRMLFLLRWS